MKKVQGNDVLHRISYLYQISKFIAPKNKILSAYYGNLVVTVAKKGVQKIHPGIKRQICKKCRCLLIDNESAITKIKTVKKTKYLIWTCLICKSKKKLVIPKDRDSRIWVEKPEAVLEVIDHNK